MPSYGLPVLGPLHDNDWVRPAGNQDMRITQTAAQHHAKLSATTGLPSPMALDIGDGNPDHDDILAPHAGKVAQALMVGSANLSIDWMEGAVQWRCVLAHMVLPHIVKVGQAISLGQLVGHMGSTSIPSMPVPLHLHIQIGYLNGSAWVWVDPWPLLQNQGGDMPGFKAAGPVIGTLTMPAGAHALISPTDTAVRYPQPAGGKFNVYAALELKDSTGKPVDIDGHSPPLNQRDQVYLVDAPNFGLAAYALRQDGTFAPTPTGHTDADLAKAAFDAANAVASAAVTEAKKYP